jgi:hypothetical protein
MGMTIVKLLVVHFIADFILQSREMGKKKSQEVKWLLAHLSIQFLAFLFFGWKFALANAAIHGVIDWNIWRLYKLFVSKRFAVVDAFNHPLFTKQSPVSSAAPEFRYWEDHWFYATIGLDQLLHGVTLVLLAEILL